MSSPSWSERLFGGFRKTSERLAANLDVVGTARLDEATLDDVEDALILSDLGPTAARRIRERLREKRFGLEISQPRKAAGTLCPRCLTTQGAATRPTALAPAPQHPGRPDCWRNGWRNG